MQGLNFSFCCRRTHGGCMVPDLLLLFEKTNIHKLLCPDGDRALSLFPGPSDEPIEAGQVYPAVRFESVAARFAGYGRIDAAKAVATARSYVASDTQAPTISIVSPTGGKVVGVVAVDVSSSDNVGVTRAELYVNGSKVATDDVGPFAFAWDTSTYGDGTYTLVAKAYDAAGNVGTSSSVSVTLGNDTTPPLISSLNPANGTTVSPSRQTVSASATDNQKVTKTSLTIDGKEVAIAYGGSVSYSWNTRKVAKGTHAITVRAWDAAGNTTSQSVSVYR